MKKVLLLTQWDDDGTYFYRLKPLFYIKNPEIIIERKPYFGNINYSFFDGYDTLIMERPSANHDLNCIKLAKQCGLKVITDWDDDCMHLDQYNPMWHTYDRDKPIVMECITLSDEIWVSTIGIKKSFKFLNKNIHVLPNAHNDYLMPIENKRAFSPDTKKAIWRGGGSHEADVYEKSEQLIEVINNNKDWQFQFIGFRFVAMEQRCGDNYLPVSLMPLMQYFKYLHTENPNIVFHPLSNNKFNESKSNIAIIEASYAGAAFFGNVSLPEFCGITLKGMSEFCKGDYDIKSLEIANSITWEYICDELLLSKVNEVRKERLIKL